MLSWLSRISSGITHSSAIDTPASRRTLLVARLSDDIAHASAGFISMTSVLRVISAVGVTLPSLSIVFLGTSMSRNA